MEKYITVKGVNTNNLKNIAVDIPRGKITAVVGVSGAGKTSLVFDTVYAEGYLRYIESISPYIRQFLDKIEKPPVESIEGLPPAISFKHKKPAKNPRSIVATSLDIFDYLRILYAKIAAFHCPGCGSIIEKYSIDEMVAEIFKLYKEKIDVCFQYKGDVSFLVNRGYYFYMDPGRGGKKRIDSGVKNRLIDVHIDSVEIKNENKSRLFEALDKSISFGGGNAHIFYPGKNNEKKKKIFPASLYCAECDVQYPPADEHLFSFNSPKGACERCKGFGDVQTLDRRLIFDPSLSLAQGAARPFNSPATRGYGNGILQYARQRGIDLDRPVKFLDKEEMDFLMEGDDTFGGVRGFFDWLKTKSYKVQARVFVSRYTSYEKCGRCGGRRLNDFALAFKIKNKNIADFLDMTIKDAGDFMRGLDPLKFKDKIPAEVVTDVRSRLDFLIHSGLYYIQLNRPTFTLSRGEFQRINLAFILGAALSDSLLILDQPSSDLHPHDYKKLETFLTRLKNNGNTLLIIEHNRDIVKYCDYVLELGPLSGEKGGWLVFKGNKKDFFKVPAGSPASTITRDYFNRPVSLKKKKKIFKDWLHFKNADSHNLKNFDFKIPWNSFTIIAGVSGAGKTTLLNNEINQKLLRGVQGGGFLEMSPPARRRQVIKEVVFIDPGLERTRSSANIAGFFDVFTAIREIFAGLKESRLQHYTPGHFSFNSPLGRCEECKGKGFSEIEMQFLAPVNLQCGHCMGKGYKPDILKIKYKNRNIREMLDLSIEGFIDAAGSDLPAAKRKILRNIKDNGLGYVKLGQRLKTLSAGELQRIKLLKYLNLEKTGALFLIDEPAFGMHAYDIEMVKKLIDKILANKNTVVAAEHNMNLIAHADYLIELGPGGGEDGGNLLFQGFLVDIPGNEHSLIGIYLKKNYKK